MTELEKDLLARCCNRCNQDIASYGAYPSNMSPMVLEITGAHVDRQDEVFTSEALALVEKLHLELNPRRLELLQRRAQRIKDIALGKELHFLEETKNIRKDSSI